MINDSAKQQRILDIDYFRSVREAKLKASFITEFSVAFI
jgi:hypothetical protein